MAQPTSVAGAESVGTPGLDRHRLLAKGAHDSIGLGVVAGEDENNMRTQTDSGAHFASGAREDTANRDALTEKTIRSTMVVF